MNFVSLFEKYDWISGPWVIHTAMEHWATLTVNSSGNVVPERLYQINLFESLFLKVRYQSLDEQKEWNKLMSKFYDRIMKLANTYEDTFSTKNLKSIQEYLNRISDTDTEHLQIPENTKVRKIRNPHHVTEQHDGIRIAEFMLQMDKEEALSFLIKLSVYWAAKLSPNSSYEQGKSLCLLAEQME